ncbi:MAG: histidine kinase [Pseudomonadota bacterium]
MKEGTNFFHSMAAYVTWAVVFAISVMQLWSRDSLLESVVMQLLILLLLAVAINSKVNELNQRLAFASLIAMLVLVFVLAWRVPVDFFFIYTIMWVSVSVNFLSHRQCWIVLLGISVVWYVIRAYAWQSDAAFLEILLVGTFHVFALLSSNSALQSTLANERTQELNRELLATQHLLTEASKESERTRIARDLHDLLGHHLTALTINLQVAGRLSDGAAKEKIEQCHGLAKLLLSDVREAVSTLRETPVVNLRELLALAVRDIPRLKIELNVDDGLQIKNVNIAEVILRCLQESITNTLKHSTARNMQIQVSATDQELRLQIRDDGKVALPIQPGNGLQGMQERLARLEGRLEYRAEPGMVIEISIPLGVA